MATKSPIRTTGTRRDLTTKRHQHLGSLLGQRRVTNPAPGKPTIAMSGWKTNGRTPRQTTGRK